MANNNIPTTRRKRSFSFLSLFLGFLLGIIFVLGAIGGGVALVLYTDLNTLFGWANFDNTDENGNDYVNTDPETGGISNVLELITKLSGWATNFGNLTIAEIEATLPVTNSLVDSIYNAFGDYVARDKTVLLNDIKSAKFSEMSVLLQGLVDDLVPGAMLSNIDLGEIMDNALMSTIIYGPEAKYADSNPVWYNEYIKSGDSFILNGDTDLTESEVLSAELVPYLVLQGSETGSAAAIYRLNYTVIGENYFVASFNAEEKTYAQTQIPFPHVKAAYDKCSGYYYTDENNERVIITQVTISTLSGTNGGEGMNSLLGNVELLDLLGGEQDELIVQVLGGITVGDILEGNMDISDKISDLELSVLDLGLTADSQIMMYLVYGVTSITEVQNQDYQYTAIYTDENDNQIEVYVVSDASKKVERVYQIIDGEKVNIKATTVSTITSRVDGITIPAIIDIDPNEPIMLYLGYGIYSVTPQSGDGYSYVGKYDVVGGAVDAYVTVSDNKVTGAYYYQDNVKINISGTTTDGVGDIISGVTDTLTLADILDVSADNSLMAYLAYKVTSLQAVENEEYQFTANLELPDGSVVPAYLLTDEMNNIENVYHLVEGEKVFVTGTTISGVADAIDGITIPAIVNIDPSDSIMVYLGYSIYSVTSQSGDGYSYVGKYDLSDGSTVDAYIVSNTDGTAITEAYYLDGDAKKVVISGTTTDKIGEVIGGITNKLALSDVLDIAAPTAENTNAIMMYIAYGVRSIVVSADGTITGEYVPVGIGSSGTPVPVTVNVSGNKIIGITDAQSNVYVGTTINGVSDRVTTVADNLTLGDFMDIAVPTAENTNAIMMYIAYGVRSIVVSTVDNVTTITGEYVPVGIGTSGTPVPVTVNVSGNKITGITDAQSNVYVGTTINGVSDRVTTVADNLMLGDFMDITSPTENDTNAIMMYIAYGVRSIVVSTVDNVTTITGEYVSVGGGTDVNAVPVTVNVSEGKVKSVVSISQPSTVYVGTTINGVPDRVTTVADNLTLGDFMDVTAPTENDKNTIMMYMAYGVRDITIEGGTIKGVYDPISENGSSTPIAVTVKTADNIVKSIVTESSAVCKGTTINQIQNRISGVTKSIKIGELMTVDENNSVMWALRNSTVDTLASDISKLSIQEIYHSSIYGGGTMKTVVAADATTVTADEIAFAPEYVYYVMNGDEYVLVGSGESRGKLAAFDTDQTYYTYGKAVDVWKFMLYGEESADGTGNISATTEKLYTVNQLGEIMTNTTNNISTATLYELQDAGIIDSQINLDGKLVENFAIGNYTINSLLQAIANMTNP